MSYWMEDAKEFLEDTYQTLKEYGKIIGYDANNGCELSRKIITNYDLIYEKYDPLVHEVLKKDLDKWIKRNNETIINYVKKDGE